MVLRVFLFELDEVVWMGSREEIYMYWWNTDVNLMGGGFGNIYILLLSIVCSGEEVVLWISESG